MRLTLASPKSCMPSGLRLIWFPASAAGACFHAPRRPGRMTVHRVVRVPASSFLGVSPLQSSFTLTSVQRLSGSDSLPGVSSLITTSPESVHTLSTGIPTPARFRPQAVAASRRFSPLSGSRACFIPEPCPGLDPVQGVLAPCRAPPSSGGGCLLAVEPGALSGLWGPEAARPGPRLRGLVPHGEAFSAPR